MPPKRRVKATRGKTKAIAQDLPVPDFTPLLNIMDFNKLDRILEKTLAKHFYNELETAMNELVEQKQRFKGIVSTYLGENKVPYTPKKNPPGALAWRQIGEHKALNFESDDDITDDGEASMLRNAPELRNVSPILPARRVLLLNKNAGLTPNRSCDLFVESPQTSRLKTPMRVTPKLCDLPRQAGVVPSPRPIPTRKTPATRERRKTPEFPPHFVMIEPIDPNLLPKQSNGVDAKRELETISTISCSTTSIPNTVSTFTGVGPSRLPRNFAKPAKRIEDDKTVKVKQIEEKLNHAVQNHEEILKEKAERARRDREERTRRVEMNNRRKQQQDQEQIQETKARELKLREFQAVQMQQQSLTPKSLRLNTYGTTTTQNTRIPVLTPGRQAIPVKKTKQDAASPFTFPAQSPVFVSQQNTRRKQPKPNTQANSHSKQELKKINVEAKRQIDIQKALEAERVRRAQEERDRIRREREREAERIRMEEERRARAEEVLRLEEERREAERRIQEEQQFAVAEEESMIIDSDERIINPEEENDADDDSAMDLTELIQELSMVDTQDDDGDGKENNAPQPIAKPLLPQSLNKTLEKVTAANKSSYDITPAKVFLPSTAENYNVNDLSSSDSTDDEDRPRKTIPQWARSSNLVPYVRKIDKTLNVAARSQHFGTIQAPNIVELFPSKKKYPPRTSSAIWTSPLSNPTPGYSRYQQYVSNASKYN
uniref:Inner centromere protein ARK-binding domain-containing protein n=1 Tax=Acrobeloides nanus TaxID=290746 RepID=A0A914DD45_9BILA